MPSKKEKVAIVSVVASGSLALAKFVVGVMIGSLALISDALHSLIDLGATLVTLFAVRVADRPPDAEHHYGHGKVESIAALAETALLFLLAGGVAVEAVKRLPGGEATIAFSYLPFVVLGIEMTVNAWRARALMRVARETGSQALEADSLHFTSDFFGSIPVIIGLALSAYGYAWADPVAALVVALLISVLGLRLGKRTLDTLVDTAPSGAAEKIAVALRKLPGVVDVDRVRVRTVGPRSFVDVAVNVPRTFPLDRLAEVKRTIEGAVEHVLAGADVTVTTTPIALDDETVQDRIMLIARNRGLAVHHLTVHAIGDRLAVAIDLEVDGELALGAAHEIASGLENAVNDELGPEVEVETHIEPLQAPRLEGRDCGPERVAAVQAVLSELAGLRRRARHPQCAGARHPGRRGGQFSLPRRRHAHRARGAREGRRDRARPATTRRRHQAGDRPHRAASVIVDRTFTGTEHGRALQPSAAQVVERLVRLLERIARHLRAHAGLRRDGEKLARVGAGQIGDRDDLPLLPQEAIGKARDVATCGCRRRRRGRPSSPPAAPRHQRADRREDDRRVERLRRRLARAAGPDRAERAGEILRRACRRGG